ncbi:MAG: hypothetical protein M3132_14020 [Actinomycetia bacterium]|nr:hypothetical protein [Actinomycetes bacterium]
MSNLAPSDVSGEVNPDDSTRQTPAWLIVGIVTVPTLLILFVVLGVLNFPDEGPGSVFQFPDMFRLTTPTGGDLGAHVLLPRILMDSILSSGSILGWSNAWFAGFPVLYLYFPLPMVSIVLADAFLPYEVAFKVGASAGLVALPTATFFLVRWLGFSRIVASVTAVSGGLFVFMESYGIYGGNIKSTVIGEFSFSWSLALSVLYIGLVAREVRRREPLGPWPGIVLALVAISHIVSVIVVVFASGLLLFRRSSVRPVVSSWILGFGLAAFWAMPFAVLVMQGMTPDSNWMPVTGIIGPDSPLPTEIVPVVLVGAAGLVAILRRGHQVAPLLGLTLIPLAAYFALPLLGVSSVNNARFLPYWYYGVFVLAGIGVGLGVASLGRWTRSGRHSEALGVILVTAVMMLAALVITADAPFWVHWAYSGYETKANYSEYETLMENIDALPPGRVVWEYNVDIAEYGTPLALMLIPYWSEDHPSMQGVYYESSLTTPFNFLNESEISLDPSQRISGLEYHPMDFRRATAHLGLYDVRYYVSYTESAEMAALQAGLEPVSVARPWVIFELPESQLVDVAVSEPAVWHGSGGFSGAALEWYDDIDRLDEWLTASGPEDWIRVDSVDERGVPAREVYEVSRAAVSDVRIDDQRISFDTTAIGVPHLVKVSYFPNWRVEGAEGPFRAAPSLMVVVPTEESVVLTFERSWPEKIGLFLTVVSIVGVAVWGVRRLRLRRDGRRSAGNEPLTVG